MADDVDRPPPKSPQDVVRAFDRNLAAVNEQLQRAVAGWTDVAQTVADKVARIAERIPTAAIAAALAELQRRLSESYPENWRDLEPDNLEAVLDLAVSGEMCVVWVPRAEVLTELASAGDHAAREQVLVNARATNLEDVRALLAPEPPEDAPIIEAVRSLVLEALDAADDGHDRAAQALLASALTLLLHDGFGFARLGEAFKAWRDEDPEDAVLTEMRVACLQRATVNALRDTDTGPQGFNRHGTQHGAPEFLTEASMIAGAMLLGAWVRELGWIAEALQDQDTGDDIRRP